MKTLMKTGMVILLGINMAFAASTKAKQKSATEQVLTSGAYSAQVKGIVCSGCGAYIQDTLEKFKGIDKVSVDQDKKLVQFQVKRDVKIKLGEVQKALKASADKMGMGADYQLMDIKKGS